MTQVATSPANSCNSASNSTITTSTQWFDTGEAAKQIDPLGNATSLSYSPNYAGAYPTEICNALHQCVTATYDFNLGLKTSGTDANGQTANFQYDNFGRIAQSTLPAQIVNGEAIEGTTVFTYNDTPGSLSVQHTRQQDGNTFLTD